MTGPVESMTIRELERLCDLLQKWQRSLPLNLLAGEDLWTQEATQHLIDQTADQIGRRRRAVGAVNRYRVGEA